MAIQVSGVNVIDNDRNLNVGILTATSLDVPPQALTFSPADAASGVLVGSNIVITFNAPVSKGTGNILLNKGSAGGATHETIDVTSGNVTISGSEVTINPSSDLPTGNDIYVVIPADAIINTALGAGNEIINTYNFSTGPILATAFSPSDGATDVAIDSNIVITFSENIAKGSGNITLRAGSASGTVRQTIDVTSGSVSVSGTQATINPSDFQYEEDTYVVVDAGAFLNSDSDADSGNAVINTYNFTTAPNFPALGAQGEGGTVICMSGGNLWIVAPYSSEVSRTWYCRNDAVTTANAQAACGDWFIPSVSQLYNPGRLCETYWDDYSSDTFWSNTTIDSSCSWRVYLVGTCHTDPKSFDNCVRAFRCVSY